MRQHTVDGVQLDCAFCQLFLRLAKTFLNVAPNLDLFSLYCYTRELERLGRAFLS